VTERFLLPPGYTQIPNVLLEEVLADAGLAELKITLAIARRTFGHQVWKRCFSNTRLQEFTGLSRQSVTDGLRAAEERGFVKKRHVGSNRYEYGILVKNLGSPPTGELPSNQGESSLATRERSIQEKQNPSGKQQKQGRSNELFVKDPDSSLDSVIVEIFEAWRIGTGKNGNSQLTDRRAGQIRARLREASRGASDPGDAEIALAHARAELLEAVKGMATSKWHAANGHTNFDQLFRGRDRIEDFITRLGKTAAEEPDAAERFAAYDAKIENRRQP
jgi:hypothetical protein